MNKSSKYNTLFMDSAKLSSNMSYCKIKKVGCVIVKDNRIIINSWNGTISGEGNCCETVMSDGILITKKTVVHAEANALSYAARKGISVDGATLYVTLSPCYECSKLIIQSGIKTVIYNEEYRIKDAIEFLKSANIEVIKYEK